MIVLHFVFLLIRIWKLSRCFTLKPDICQRFFSSSMVSLTVQTLDLSHCFWLSEGSLVLGCLSKLKNLTELNVLDTELSLSSIILHVMPQCKNLTKLAAKLPDPTLEDFNYKLQGFPETYKENFLKLTNLKLQVLDCSSPYIWLLIFNVLGWVWESWTSFFLLLLLYTIGFTTTDGAKIVLRYIWSFSNQEWRVMAVHGNSKRLPVPWSTCLGRNFTTTWNGWSLWKTFLFGAD